MASQSYIPIELAANHVRQEGDRFFNSSIDLLAIANFDGYFTRLNPAWEKVLGFSNAELMAQPFLDVVHPQERANFYEFAVSDRGPGIAPEYDDRVFGIFQAVNPQNRPTSSGIGLSIVKKIVEWTDVIFRRFYQSIIVVLD